MAAGGQGLVTVGGQVFVAAHSAAARHNVAAVREVDVADVVPPAVGHQAVNDDPCDRR